MFDYNNMFENVGNQTTYPSLQDAYTDMCQSHRAYVSTNGHLDMYMLTAIYRLINFIISNKYPVVLHDGTEPEDEMIIANKSFAIKSSRTGVLNNPSVFIRCRFEETVQFKKTNGIALPYDGALTIICTNNCGCTGEFYEVLNSPEYVSKYIDPYFSLIDRSKYTLSPMHKAYAFISKDCKEVLVFTNRAIDHEFIAKILGQMLIEKMNRLNINALEEMQPIIKDLSDGNLTSLFDMLEEQTRLLLLNRTNSTIEKYFNEASDLGLKRALRSQEQNKSRTEEAIATLEMDLSSAYNKLTEQLQQITATKLLIATGASNNSGTELLNYLKTTNKINDIMDIRMSSVAGSQVCAVKVRSPLLYWSERTATEYFHNPKSLFCDRNRIDVEILKKIFLTKEIVVNLYSSIIIDFANLNIYRSSSAGSMDTFIQEAAGYNSYVQPHIMRFDCWGDNKPEIKKAMKNMNIIPMWEQIMSTLNSVNLHDYTVLEYFVDNLFGYMNTKGALTYKGNAYSMKEIINELTLQEVNNEKINVD